MTKEEIEREIEERRTVNPSLSPEEVKKYSQIKGAVQEGLRRTSLNDPLYRELFGHDDPL